MKKIVLIITAITITNFMSGAVTVQELKNKENEAYDALSDVWINEKGDVRVGGNKKDAQFVFDEPFLARRSIEQINKSIKTATSGLTTEQQQKFMKAIEDDFKKLEKARADLKLQRDELDTIATKLASLLGKKTKEDILKLPDQNIAALISKISAGSKKIDANREFSKFKPLRAVFDIKTTETPITTSAAGKTKPSTLEDEDEDFETPSSRKGTKSSAGRGKSTGKVVAAASLVANAETKLSTIIKASASIAAVDPRTDIHFDIVPGDEPGSVLFLRTTK